MRSLLHLLSKSNVGFSAISTTLYCPVAGTANNTMLLKATVPVPNQNWNYLEVCFVAVAQLYFYETVRRNTNFFILFIDLLMLCHGPDGSITETRHHTTYQSATNVGDLNKKPLKIKVYIRSAMRAISATECYKIQQFMAAMVTVVIQ